MLSKSGTQFDTHFMVRFRGSHLPLPPFCYVFESQKNDIVNTLEKAQCALFHPVSQWLTGRAKHASVDYEVHGKTAYAASSGEFCRRLQKNQFDSFEVLLLSDSPFWLAPESVLFEETAKKAERYVTAQPFCRSSIFSTPIFMLQ